MAITKLQAHKNTLIEIGIEGISPLLMHAWTEKAKRMMAMTAPRRKIEAGKLKGIPRDPEAEALASAYYTDSGEYGLPLTAFKGSLINTAHKDEGVEKTVIRKSIFIPTNDSNLCVPISYEKEPYVRTDMVRVGMGSTDMRYRLCFEQWKASFTLFVDTARLSIENVIILADKAGFSTGVGDWRPQTGGEMGRFRVDTAVPVRELDPVTFEPLKRQA